VDDAVVHREQKPIANDELVIELLDDERGAVPDQDGELRGAGGRVADRRDLRAATCQDTTTPDQHFVIATHPEHPQVAAGCGFSGHGFKFVPVVGEILADLVTSGSTAHPIGLFDPRREV
jgi:glycine/D-amino acid oxidase-like deaminating enzyme